MIEVKRLSKTDLDQVEYILTNLVDDPTEEKFPSHLKKLLADNNTYLFAAYIDNEIIGFALAYKFLSLYSPGYLAYLYDIGVEEEYKRKGAGRQLIEQLIEALKKDNVTELWLGTGSKNKEGQGLFTATGAQRSDEDFNDFTYYL